MNKSTTTTTSDPGTLLERVEVALTNIVRTEQPITMRSFVALLAISQKQMTTTELGLRLGVNKSTASRIVIALEQSGYLLREPPAERHRVIRVLPAGVAYLDALVREVSNGNHRHRRAG